MAWKEDWKVLKKELGIKNKDLTGILGVTLKAVEAAMANTKEPSWFKFGTYIQKFYKEKMITQEEINKFCELLTNNINEQLKSTPKGLMREKVYNGAGSAFVCVSNGLIQAAIYKDDKPLDMPEAVSYTHLTLPTIA